MTAFDRPRLPRLDPTATGSERTEFMEELRTLIEEGAYVVEAQEVAEAIVDFRLGPQAGQTRGGSVPPTPELT